MNLKAHTPEAVKSKGFSQVLFSLDGGSLSGEQPWG
jgi:hypothetical protein